MIAALKDKLVFITGASSGIGRATARAFAADGARLLLCARRIERLKELEENLYPTDRSDQVLSIQLDVRDRAAVEKALDNLPKEWRAIDILVNSAGLSRGLDKFQDANLDDWDEMLEYQRQGVALCNASGRSGNGGTRAWAHYQYWFHCGT